MDNHASFRLQCIVFALVSASFTNVYITQPVLPILQNEFAADMVLVSFSVSAVILGIAISNLPFGALADKVPIQPIILCGGIMVVIGGLICSLTENFWIFLGARFFQGLFIPCLTTCLAAYLAKTLPIERLNIVMGWLVCVCNRTRRIVRSSTRRLDPSTIALAICLLVSSTTHHCSYRYCCARITTAYGEKEKTT